MDPNLQKIKQDNMYAITHGSIQEAVSQAEDYLRYVTGFNTEQFNTELEDFVANVKQIRRKSRGQKRKEKYNKPKG